MNSKLVVLGIISLFIVMSFVRADSMGPYDPLADVNKDGIVDILDLVEVGQVYGSNYTLVTIANKTVITVVSFAKDPPEIEGALVVINPGRYAIGAVTNSTGVALFDLSPNSTYTVRAFKDSGTNTVGFSTNSHGEASVLIVLGEPSVSAICNIGFDEVWVTMIDNVTGEYYTGTTDFPWWAIKVYEMSSDSFEIVESVDMLYGFPPAMHWHPLQDSAYYVAHRSYLFSVSDERTMFSFTGCLQLDSDFSANVKVYGNFSALE